MALTTDRPFGRNLGVFGINWRGQDHNAPYPCHKINYAYLQSGPVGTSDGKMARISTIHALR